MFLSHLFTISALNMFQIHETPEGPNSPDFRFPAAWGENGYPVEGDIRGDERESKLQLQADTQDDDYSSYPSPLWKTIHSKADVRPLLPLGHPCSNLSPRSMTHAISNSREEMMKMIRDLPESSYELSLKDIVDLRISQETKPEPTIDEEPAGFAIDPQQRIPKKKISKITRSESMNNHALLIKSFFPSFSNSKRKLPPGNMSRIIPRSSSIIGSQRSDDKKQWIGKPANETAGLSNNSVNKFRRHDDEKHETTGCWPSLSGRKNRTRRKNGCLF